MGDQTQDTRQNVGGEPDSDLLEHLLFTAAEKVAQKEAEDAIKKGFVTREQINAALASFGEELETRIVSSVKDALMPQIEDVVKKAQPAGSRKSDILTPEEEREADPVAYLIRKGREAGAEAYDEVDKRLIWGLTHAALTEGMQFDNREKE